MSVVDIIDTGKGFLIGELHKSGVFGVRAETENLADAWTKANELSARYGLEIRVVSDSVKRGLEELGLLVGASEEVAPGEKP